MNEPCQHNTLRCNSCMRTFDRKEFAVQIERTCTWKNGLLAGYYKTDCGLVFFHEDLGLGSYCRCGGKINTEIKNGA